MTKKEKMMACCNAMLHGQKLSIKLYASLNSITGNVINISLTGITIVYKHNDKLQQLKCYYSSINSLKRLEV